MPTAKRKHALAQAEVVIPEKIYFRIGEVSMYRRRDVEFVMHIRKLLYEDGFTIAGARERLREELRGSRRPQLSETMQKTLPPPTVLSSQGNLPFPGPPPSERQKQELQQLRRQLCEVLDLLS
jgi:hypothetical protein